MSEEYIITSRGVKNKIIGPIIEPQLSADMERLRSGHLQLFRKKNTEDRTFISKNNADVVLVPEEKHIYAALFGEKWVWVNGCCECNGEERDWVNSYIECTNHDVCRSCKAPRSEVKTCWAGKNGWQCEVCKESEQGQRKKDLLKNAKEYNEWDFSGLSNIKCPCCNDEFNEYWEFVDTSSDRDQEIDCPTCETKFNVVVNTSISFDITLKKDD